MAGTATNYNESVIVVDTIAQIWAGLEIPSAGDILTLAADGTPDATANPDAIHLGHTKEGVKLTIGTSLTKHYVDELAEPIKATVDTTEMMFEGEFLQVMDEEVLKKLTAAFGTYDNSSPANTEVFNIGRKALVYDSVALIFQTPMSLDSVTPKFAVAHIYNGINEAGLSYQVSRKGMAGTPFKFVAYGISSRAANDSVGAYWWQTA
jgi:hypothetical protein